MQIIITPTTRSLNSTKLRPIVDNFIIRMQRPPCNAVMWKFEYMNIPNMITDTIHLMDIVTQIMTSNKTMEAMADMEVMVGKEVMVDTERSEERWTSVFLVWSLPDMCYGEGWIDFGEKSHYLGSHPHRLTQRSHDDLNYFSRRFCWFLLSFLEISPVLRHLFHLWFQQVLKVLVVKGAWGNYGASQGRETHNQQSAPPLNHARHYAGMLMWEVFWVIRA